MADHRLQEEDGLEEYNRPTGEEDIEENKPRSTGPRVTFTVTRVPDEDHNSQVSLAASQNDTRPPEDGAVNNGPIKQEQVTLQVPDYQGPSDSESTYGDTLTQTSITKLLSKKFKSSLPTYRTYRYDISKRDKSAAEQKAAKGQKPALRKRLISKYESQDYDQIENSLFFKEQETFKSLKIHRKWLARWIVSLLIGIGTALVATVIEVCIEYTTEYKYLAMKKLVNRCRGGACVAIPLICWVTINTTLVFLGSLLVTCVEPQAAGSGIPQIKCYLNGVKIPGLLTLRALFAKSVGVILSVAGGLACGKEGPMIHSGAIVAAGVSQGRSRLFNKDFRIFEYLRSDTERRDFVSGGAAAGVSAAFGAPVGGVLFSLEEGASFWNQSLTWRIVFASMVATFTVNVLLSALHGHPADLSNPGLISFGKFSETTYQAIEIPVFLLMAVIGGLSGALFNTINAKLTVFRKRYIVAKWAKITEASIVACMSAVIGFCLMYTVNECVPTSQEDKDHPEAVVQLHCPDGHHNVMSSIFFKTPEGSLIALLHDRMGSYTVVSLALFSVIYFFLACWTYGLSVSSGIFIPCLLTGAAWGRIVGIGVLHLFPKMINVNQGLHENNNVGKYALIGAACQLGGTVRMTISLTVILIECTGDITFGLPIVMVLIIAKWVGDFFNSGLYDLHIQMMGIPLLPWEPPEMSYDITAKQVMNKPVVVLRTVETVRRILEVIDTMPHSGFPVVDDYDADQEVIVRAQGEAGKDDVKDEGYGKCRGLILRSQLCLLLKHKVFSNEGTATECTTPQNPGLRLEDFRDAYPQHLTTLEVNLSEEDKGCSIDLRPYMNPTPYSVTLNTSLPRMFRLFRGLGLRHLVVINEQNQVGHRVVGMVTKKKKVPTATLR